MEWISVEERLPAFQEETSILCLLKDQQKGFGIHALTLF